MGNYIRVSASYLFNISFEGNDGEPRFLLIESERRKGKYQPIGGCYKFYLSAKNYLEELGCKFENMSNGVDSSFDLRLLIPQENIKSFIEWYLSGKGRETSFERELEEELIGNLPESSKHIFKDLQMFLIKKEKDFKPFFDVEKDIMTIKPVDVVKLELTKRQKDGLLALCSKSDTKFILASKEDILKEQKVFSNGKVAAIGAHTKYILCNEDAEQLGTRSE